MVAESTPPLLQCNGGSFTGSSESGRTYGVGHEGSGGVAYVQQRGGGDFTGPLGTQPGLHGLVCPCYRVRSAPAAVAVKEVLQVAVLLSLSGSNGMVCSY